MTQKEFEKYLRDRGLRSTLQRQQLACLFLQADKHVTAEELYDEARKIDPSIGHATVYRTLKLLVDAGVAEERQFDRGVIRFEPVHSGQDHDHLICEKCGRIIEFADDEIERLRAQLAASYDFEIRSKKCELYGLCSNCRKERRRKST